MTHIEAIFCQNNSVFCNPEMKKFLPRIKPTSPLDERLERFNSKVPELSSFQPGSLSSSSSSVGKRYAFVPTLYEERLNFPTQQDEQVLRSVNNYLGRDQQRDVEEILAEEPKKKPEPEPILEPETKENAPTAVASIPTEPEVINMALVSDDDAPPLKRSLEDDSDSDEPAAKKPTRRSSRPIPDKKPLPYDEDLKKAVVVDDYDSDEEDFSDLQYETAPPATTLKKVTYAEPEDDIDIVREAKEKKIREFEAKKRYSMSKLKLADIPSMQKFKKATEVENYEVYRQFKSACEQAISEVAAECFGSSLSHKPPALIATLMESAQRVLSPTDLRSDKMLQVQLLCWKYMKIDYEKQTSGWKIVLSRPQKQFKKLPSTWTLECDDDAAIAIQYLHSALYPYPFILELARTQATVLLAQNNRLKTAPQLADALRQNDVRIKSWFVQWCVQAVLAGIPEFSPL